MAAAELSVHGAEKTDETGRLCRLNLAVHGLEGEIKLGGDEARAKIQEVFGAGSAGVPPASGKRAAGGTPALPGFCDVPGLCKAATLKEIEAQGWSLNPGRYVGVAAGEAVSDEDFKEQLETLNEELVALNAHARDLEQTIAGNVAEILEA